MSISEALKARSVSTKCTNLQHRLTTAGSSAVRRSRSLVIRKDESAVEPGISSMVGGGSLLLGWGVTRRRRVQCPGKLTDVPTFEGRDLADSLLFHFVHPQHGMQGQVGPLNPVEFALDALFARIQHYGGALAEHQILHFQEAE